ncbi:hypothetical protein Q5H92_21770 [Hymenobacter sp. M29]|uniref:Tip attachment protein J domain-containing protein n=1 Tax=Hymenobacter mellowenesis TaxID=3063995 RepID=A0ABT9AGL0_9BACT|nr:hypothetical protein [Hymenobacter sp. M29]MDO7849008.1 hypothetical protein [Hymenobacter sp. M29]
MRALSLSFFGLQADLPTVTKGLIRLTQARAALAELSGRNGEFSWPITLPPTRNNARIFGVSALHSLGLDKFTTVDFPFELRCAGEIFTGTFRLTSMRAGYTGNLIGTAYSCPAEIGDKKLTDLKLAPVAYDGSQLESILALDCDGSDIQFPLLSFGNFYAPPRPVTQLDGTEKDESLPAQALIDYPLSVDDYAPSVYYRNVLQQIFTDIGWTLTGRVLDEQLWRETVIAPAGSRPESAWPWGTLLRAEAQQSAAILGQYCYYGAGTGNGYTNTAVGFANPGEAGNINGHDMAGEVAFLPVSTPVALSGGTRALDTTAATYIAPRAGLYSFEASCSIASGHQLVQSVAGALATPTMRADFSKILLCLFIRRGGESFDASCLRHGAVVDPLQIPDFVNLAGSFDGAGNIGGQSFDLAADDVYLDAGDSLQFCVMVRRQLIDAPENRSYLARREFVLNFSAARFACTAAEGETLLSPALFLPPLAQRDVIRDFMLRTDTVALADAGRRTVALLTRDELRKAAGKPLDLTHLIDPQLMEYTPAAGAGVGAVVFGSAQNSEEPLPAGLSDVVRIIVGPGATEQRIDSLFAPVALRSYLIPQPGTVPARAAVPTMSTADVLAQPLAEVAPDVSGQAPRLLRHLGVLDGVTVPFQTRRVSLARAEWADALRFDGPAGAVATYYPATVARLLRGHVGKAPVSLTPALYRALTPGRGVIIAGAEYAVETVSGFDIADEAAETTLELIREM